MRPLQTASSRRRLFYLSAHMRMHNRYVVHTQIVIHTCVPASVHSCRRNPEGKEGEGQDTICGSADIEGRLKMYHLNGGLSAGHATPLSTDHATQSVMGARLDPTPATGTARTLSMPRPLFSPVPAGMPLHSSFSWTPLLPHQRQAGHFIAAPSPLLLSPGAGRPLHSSGRMSRRSLRRHRTVRRRPSRS